MGKSFLKIYPQPWVQIAILIGFCVVLYFLSLGRWDLWNPDEPRYAQVAREMVDRGDWLLMHYNGKVYADKPPLFFWLIGFSSFVWQGFSSFSVRFPAAFFGTLTGLPVIQTLRDLRETGDEIRRIEGMFSGTLAYLFNTWDGSQSFSSVVRHAKSLGYTEPDPRDDLSGMDVARKLIILRVKWACG